MPIHMLPKVVPMPLGMGYSLPTRSWVAEVDIELIPPRGSHREEAEGKSKVPLEDHLLVAFFPVQKSDTQLWHKQTVEHGNLQRAQ